MDFSGSFYVNVDVVVDITSGGRRINQLIGAEIFYNGSCDYSDASTYYNKIIDDIYIEYDCDEYTAMNIEMLNTINPRDFEDDAYFDANLRNF